MFVLRLNLAVSAGCRRFGITTDDGMNLWYGFFRKEEYVSGDVLATRAGLEKCLWLGKKMVEGGAARENRFRLSVSLMSGHVDKKDVRWFEVRGRFAKLQAFVDMKDRCLLEKSPAGVLVMGSGYMRPDLERCARYVEVVGVG